jgi:predicted metal-dependent HD superfamily phosphohydrolase
VSAPEIELTIAWQRSVDGDTHLLDGLLARHREPVRRYHTAHHVRWVLRHIDELALVERLTHLDDIVAAAFYHDAVYDPRRSDNERVSADLARRDLTTLGWAGARVDRVGSMIEATAHVDGESPRHDDIDTAALLDADLAVLGADAAGYSAYVTGVRHEYAHVDDDAWRVGRGRVLGHFLALPSIYATAEGRSRWEVAARANLTAELATLR